MTANLVFGCDKAETYRCYEATKFAGYHTEHTNTALSDGVLYDASGLPDPNGKGVGYRRVPTYAITYTCGAVEPGQTTTSPGGRQRPRRRARPRQRSERPSLRREDWPQRASTFLLWRAA